MPGRDIPLATDEIYHVFNRGITDLIVFPDDRYYQRALETISFYRYKKYTHRFSYYVRLSQTKKDEIFQYGDHQTQVSILSYCLMPNHFHFVIRQTRDQGIQNFISLFSNSYTRYFNTKKRRIGPVFQGKFKSVRVESEEQLIHVCRYVHLNPYSSGLVKATADLEGYSYSSYKEYLHPESPRICNTQEILGLFPDREEYRKFVSDYSDYQRQLELVKHLTIDL